jgi:hypothetical protein
VVAGPVCVCLRSCIDGPTETFLCDIIGSIIDQLVSFLDPSSFVIFIFSPECSSKEKFSFWCENTIICHFKKRILLSALFVAWLHISDNMIGLHKIPYGANSLLAVRLP